MQDVADELSRVTGEAAARLRAMDEGAAAQTRGSGTWSNKEVLGHLVDSALNNHQRFVRAQLSSPLVFPGYEQEGWVSVQAYRDRAWERLVALWTEANLHLAHVISRIPADRRATSCRIGEGEPVTLEFVARDYVRHLRHHLEQIFEPDAASGKRHAPFASPRV